MVRNLNTFRKVALIIVGYLAAALMGLVVTYLYIVATDGPPRDASSGMYAFGDSLVFLAVFSAASVPVSGVLLYFLRPVDNFWRFLIAAVVLIELIGVLALITSTSSSVSANDYMKAFSTFAPLRMIICPFLGLGYLLAFIFAPRRSHRIAFLGATGVELLGFAVWLGKLWFEIRE